MHSHLKFLAIWIIAALAGCSVNEATFNLPPPTIGGTITNLHGSGLVLINNHGDDILSVNADGTFVFANPVPIGANYNVTVDMQPSLPTQECTVTNGTGTVGASGVNNVDIRCETKAFTISGTVTGLLSSSLVLQNNGADDILINADGSFTFANPITSGSRFEVTVRTAPAMPSQTCRVLGGTGTIGSGDVTSVAINCMTNAYTISGTISGLSRSVTLRNNTGDDLVITANGTFAFSTPVLSGATYGVTVPTQPDHPWQTCTVTAGTGTVTNADVTSIAVACTTNLYHVGGVVSGFASTNSVTLRNNGSDDLIVMGSRDFRFPTLVASGQPYHATIVAISTPQISQRCFLLNENDYVAGEDVTIVFVMCMTNSFTIGGTVSGLTGTGLVLNNVGDQIAITGNGAFTFPNPRVSSAPYAVTVMTQPSGQTCTVANGTGTVGLGNVTNVQVTCAP